MTNQDLKEWRALQKQFVNDYHMSKHDWSTLVHLNHLVMEATHSIHNKSMEKL